MNESCCVRFPFNIMLNTGTTSKAYSHVISDLVSPKWRNVPVYEVKNSLAIHDKRGKLFSIGSDSARLTICLSSAWFLTISSLKIEKNGVGHKNIEKVRLDDLFHPFKYCFLIVFDGWYWSGFFVPMIFRFPFIWVFDFDLLLCLFIW